MHYKSLCPVCQIYKKICVRPQFSDAATAAVFFIPRVPLSRKAHSAHTGLAT